MKTKYVSLSLLIITLFVGCTSQPLTQKYTGKRDIAYRALQLDSTYWNCTKEVKILDHLCRRISYEMDKIPPGSEPGEFPKAVLRASVADGFAITNGSTLTFRDALKFRELDCSDLVLLGVQEMERRDLHPQVALGRYHIMLVLEREYWPVYRDELQDPSFLIFLDPTNGKEYSRETLEKETATPFETITNYVYLRRISSENSLLSVYMEMAQKLSRNHKKAEAEKCYTKAIQLHSRFVSGYESFAAFLARQGRFEEAETLLLRAIELDSTNAELYDFASALYCQLGNTGRAQEMCKKAIENKTTDKDTVKRYLTLLLPGN